MPIASSWTADVSVAADVVGSSPGHQAGTGAAGVKDRPSTALQFRSLGEIAQTVRDAPAPTWLIRGLWPADAYGILGAQDKAGKTWAVLDLAVAVASGGTFMNHWAVETAGPVLVFAGEGSERKMIRRLYAIGAHYGMNRHQVDALPIRMSMRVPHLDTPSHVAQVMAELDANPPRLVVLDPLYLAAAGAESSQLMKMAVPLGTIQHAAQGANAALVVVHHWNQTGSGTGKQRFSGAGTTEWGRVLASMSVTGRATEDPAGVQRSVVDLKIEVTGDEVADIEVSFRRKIWTDDPDDLTSPMHYEVESMTDERESSRSGGSTPYDQRRLVLRDVRAFFTTHPDGVRSKRALYDGMRKAGCEHKDRAITEAAHELVTEGFLTHEKGPRNSDRYALAVEPATADG
jgi:hypothetical protein